MKKFIAMVLCLVLALSLVGCGKNTYRIGILIPAEYSDGFLWADEEISPEGRRITIASSNEFGDVEFMLKPVEVKEENAYEPIILSPGQSVTRNAEKGAWFKIGMRMLNNAVPGKVKYFEIKGVTVRIASEDDKSSEFPENNMINPWTDWNSVTEAENAAGFSFGLPETIEGSYVAESYRTMSGETPIIEVTYADEDWTVVVRKAPGEGRDISGIYDHNDIQTGERHGEQITYYRQHDSKSSSLKIVISDDGYSWSVYAPNGFWGGSCDSFLISIFEQ